jgi:hypothetical protein
VIRALLVFGGMLAAFLVGFGAATFSADRRSFRYLVDETDRAGA